MGPCVVQCCICALGLNFLSLYAQAPSCWPLMSYLHYWWWCHPCFDGDWHAHNDTWLPTPPTNSVFNTLVKTPVITALSNQCHVRPLCLTASICQYTHYIITRPTLHSLPKLYIILQYTCLLYQKLMKMFYRNIKMFFFQGGGELFWMN